MENNIISGIISVVSDSETYYPIAGLNADGEVDINFSADGLKYYVSSLPEHPLFVCLYPLHSSLFVINIII